MRKAVKNEYSSYNLVVQALRDVGDQHKNLSSS